MFLNVPETAALLGVSEKTIYRHVKQGNVPFYRVGEQYRFSRAELLAWATSRRLDVPESLFHDSLHCTVPLPTLTEALKEGGITYRVEGRDKESVLRQLAEVARFTYPVARDHLFRLLLAREALGSTGVGHGIAVPQLVYPTTLDLGGPTVSLIFLETPVDFEALDEAPVVCLLGVFSATLRGHYHLLERIHFALRDSGVRDALESQAGREEILNEFGRVESKLRTL